MNDHRLQRKEGKGWKKCWAGKEQEDVTCFTWSGINAVSHHKHKQAECYIHKVRASGATKNREWRRTEAKPTTKPKCSWRNYRLSSAAASLPFNCLLLLLTLHQTCQHAWCFHRYHQQFKQNIVLLDARKQNCLCSLGWSSSCLFSTEVRRVNAVSSLLVSSRF